MLVWSTGCAGAQLKHHKSFAHRKDVQKFIHEMHQKHGINEKTLTEHFKKFHTNKKVIALMDKQFKPSPWYNYHNRLITQKRISDGIRFWKENQKSLEKAEQRFGVPAEIIVAIIGIESSYGQITGTYPVLQTLATLAFDYPRRAPFFRKELEHFLLISEEGSLHPTKTLGSYAGAMGMPQFMPSSYRQFAVDFSGSGKRDLIYNKADVIGSVANYLSTHGWQAAKPIIHKAKVSGTKYKMLLNPKDPKPRLTLNELAKYNIQLVQQKKWNNEIHKARLIELETAKNIKEHWLGFHNFYVITRYNNSIFYATAVYLLSERIRSSYPR